MSATLKVFSLPEIMEMVLLLLPDIRTLLLARRAHSTFRDTIDTSKTLARKIGKPKRRSRGPLAVKINSLLHGLSEKDIKEAYANGAINDDELDTSSRPIPDFIASVKGRKVHFRRTTIDFSGEYEGLEASCLRLPLTSHAARIIVEVENRNQGSRWNNVRVETSRATLDQLLELSRVIAGVAEEHWEKVEEDDEAYEALLYSHMDILDLEWEDAVEEAGLMRFVRGDVEIDWTAREGM